MEKRIAQSGTYKGYKYAIVEFANNYDLFWFQRGVPDKYYCGYVLVPQWHSAYEVDYNSLGILVYGGLTFSNHTLMDVEYPGWWIGFDCAHADDIENPKDLQFCIVQCHGIIDQLREMENM